MMENESNHVDGSGMGHELYVLVEFPEDSAYFEDNGIGYPSFNREDNGARYVSQCDYTHHFQKEPPRNAYYKPIRWPESQQYLEMEPESAAALCEPIIADGKAFEDFGPSAIWLPSCLINNR